jgi:hypothetical protein
MNNTITKIQLLGDVQGYLDVSENIIVPINFGVGDVRDLSKRTGTFSKTIVLPGTKNNNQLLNSYYDINIVAGTFSINKLQKCIILQNNIPIVDDAYLQLVAVNKIQNVLNEDDQVEYEVVIKDNVGDFFTKLGNRTLDGRDEAGTPFLDFSRFDHTFTAAAISESFDNTFVDGYKYLIPWVDDSELQINECKPAIYAKQYWDNIHASTGFTYSWSTLFNPDVQFDKLVIPYNGDDKKLSEEVAATIATKVQRGILGSMASNAPGYSSTAGLIGIRVFTDYNTIVEDRKSNV